MDTSQRAERRFYLEHFRGRSLVIGGDDHGSPEVEATLASLVAEGARVVRVQPDPLGEGLRTDPDVLAERWTTLRATGRVDITGPPDEVLAVATDIACRLRPFKLVLLDPAAPVAGDRPPPFVTLTADAPVPDATAGLAQRALAAGVGSVNVCRPGDVEEELLTYHGAGVLYTPEQYCHVERLRLDDFEGAHRLIEQGVGEGFLLPRSPGDVAVTLLRGYGARFGDDHLAGFAALTPHPGARMAEVTSLTTISRFTGGGVGGMIVRRMLADASAEGLAGVFACTTSREAAGFFAALGFAEVGQEALPASKWEGYDPARRSRLIALLHRLAP